MPYSQPTLTPALIVDCVAMVIAAAVIYRQTALGPARTVPWAAIRAAVVHAGTYWSGDGWTRNSWWAGLPAFGGGLAMEGFVWSGVVVVRAPPVELVLQLF